MNGNPVQKRLTAAPAPPPGEAKSIPPRLRPMGGRTLSHAVDSPVITSRRYAIRRAVPDLTDGVPAIEYRARLVRFDMPAPTGWP